MKVELAGHVAGGRSGSRQTFGSGRHLHYDKADAPVVQSGWNSPKVIHEMDGLRYLLGSFFLLVRIYLSID